MLLNCLLSKTFNGLKVRKALIGKKEPSSKFKPIYGAEIKEWRNYVYWKGDDERVINGMKENGVIINESDIEDYILSYNQDPFEFFEVGIRLIYTAIRVLFSKNGFYVIRKETLLPRGTLSERVTPKVIKIAEEQPFGNGYLLAKSLNFKLDPRPNKTLYLWIDSQKHIIAEDEPKLSGRFKFYANDKIYRILTKRERDEKGLTNLFLDISRKNPASYFEEIRSMMGNVTDGNSFQIPFSDGDVIEFEFNFMNKPIVKLDDIKYVTSDVVTTLPPPAVKFATQDYLSLYSGLLNDMAWQIDPTKNRKILILCDEKYKNYLKSFWKLLTKGGYDKWRGFMSTFGIAITPDADSLEMSDLVRMLKINDENELVNLVNENVRMIKDADLVLLIAEDDILHSQYYTLKKMILDAGYISQLVNATTLKKIVDQYDTFSLINLSLGMFVKLGGIPWILASSTAAKYKSQAYIGLGFSKDFSGTDITYGVAYLFDKRGYTVDVFVETFSDGGDYMEVGGLYLPKNKMERILKSAINKVRQVYRFKDEEPVSLVLHKTSPIHREEREAAEVVSNGKNSIIYLVHVVTNNIYRGLEYIQGRPSNSKRGTFYYIDDNRGVLWTVGARSKPMDFLTRPIEISLDGIFMPSNTPEIPLHDIVEISEQIYALTMMNWRSGNLRREPATINYAREAARFVKYGIQLNAKNWSIII